MTVLFVGDKPSSKNTSPEKAFLGTRSYKVLKEWAERLHVNGDKMEMVNRVSPRFNIMVAVAHMYGYPIICLGKEAEKAVREWRNVVDAPLKEGRDFFCLPHPSGRNRKLNREEFVDKELLKCWNFLSNRGYYEI